MLNIGGGSLQTALLTITGTASVGAGGGLIVSGSVNVSSPGVLYVAAGGSFFKPRRWASPAAR